MSDPQPRSTRAPEAFWALAGLALMFFSVLAGIALIAWAGGFR